MGFFFLFLVIDPLVLVINFKYPSEESNSPSASDLKVIF